MKKVLNTKKLMSKNNNIFDQISEKPIQTIFISLGISFLLMIFTFVNDNSPSISQKDIIIKANAYLNSAQAERDSEKRMKLIAKGGNLLEDGKLNRFAEANLSRSYFFLLTNQLDAAYEAVKKAERLDSRKNNLTKEINQFYGAITSKLAVELSNNKKFEEAFMMAKEGLTKNPRNPELYNVIGVFYYSKQNVDSAFAYFNTAYQLNPKLKSARSNIFNLFMHQGNQALKNNDVLRAFQMHNQALQFDNGNINLLNLLVEESIELNKFNKANEYLNLIFKKDPNNKRAKKLSKKLK